jgi:hypothetical protein
MQLDLPLRRLNSKLPSRSPWFYFKLVFWFFVLNIGVFLVLLVASVPMEVVNTITAITSAGLAAAFLFGCLSLLYNAKTGVVDTISIYAPAITSQPIFGTVNSIFASIGRGLLVLLSYLLILFVPLFTVGAIYAAFKS